MTDIQAALEEIPGHRIAVVGDIMIDEWIWGSVSRISPEAPVPVVGVSDHSYTLGGAGNVAKNLEALGAHVTLISGVGSDAFGDMARSLLTDAIEDRLITLSDRPTTRKTRIVAHSQQVVRVDWESAAPICDADRQRLINEIRTVAADADAIIFSDYAKGILSRPLVEAAAACPVILADPKPQNALIFQGATCIAPNVGEAGRAAGMAITDQTTLELAGAKIVSMMGCRYAVITRGENGMSLFGRDGERFDMPSVARSVYDVSGAGDTVIAALAAALAANVPIELSMRIATYAAGAVVEKLGTAAVYPEEVLEMAKAVPVSAGAPIGNVLV